MTARALGLSRRALLGLGAVTLAAGAGAATLRLAPRIYNGRRLRALQGKNVYDEHADATLLLTEALGRAVREQRRVLVVLGGNWCPWCLAFDDLLSTDAEVRGVVDARYVVLKLDGDAAEALDVRWGRPTRLGVPVLVFLEPDGRVARVEGTVPLESWGGRFLRHDRGRVLEVLSRRM